MPAPIEVTEHTHPPAPSPQPKPQLPGFLFAAEVTQGTIDQAHEASNSSRDQKGVVSNTAITLCTWFPHHQWIFVQLRM